MTALVVRVDTAQDQAADRYSKAKSSRGPARRSIFAPERGGSHNVCQVTAEDGNALLIAPPAPGEVEVSAEPKTKRAFFTVLAGHRQTGPGWDNREHDAGDLMKENLGAHLHQRRRGRQRQLGNAELRPCTTIEGVNGYQGRLDTQGGYLREAL